MLFSRVKMMKIDGVVRIEREISNGKKKIQLK